MKVEVRSLAIRPMNAGRLVALADVSLCWEEMSFTIRSIRIEAMGSGGAGGTKVSMPVDRDGRAVLVLPPELSDAVAEVVLAAGIEGGILKTRGSDPAST
jgi:hypothetical protein